VCVCTYQFKGAVLVRNRNGHIILFPKLQTDVHCNITVDRTVMTVTLQNTNTNSSTSIIGPPTTRTFALFDYVTVHVGVSERGRYRRSVPVLTLVWSKVITHSNVQFNVKHIDVSAFRTSLKDIGRAVVEQVIIYYYLLLLLLIITYYFCVFF